MSKTMLLALIGLGLGLAGLAACAQPADQGDAESLIEAERPPASDDGGDGGGCAEQGDFDVDVFADEILPILSGDIDLNDPDGDPSTGCARGPCHGTPRPDGYHLDLADTPENNLERFACFVDLRRPKRSQILVCPAGDERCAVAPHPGAPVFTGPGDLNYERILDYIRASRP